MFASKENISRLIMQIALDSKHTIQKLATNVQNSHFEKTISIENKGTQRRGWIREKVEGNVLLQ